MLCTRRPCWQTLFRALLNTGMNICIVLWRGASTRIEGGARGVSGRRGFCFVPLPPSCRDAIAQNDAMGRRYSW
jgi:hypothetical protein